MNYTLDRTVLHASTKALLLSSALILASCGTPSLAQQQVYQSDEHSFRLVALTEGLEHPWALAFLPDGRMLITERPGRLRVIQEDGQLVPEPLEGTPEVVSSGQGGLLDIALHPNFEENRLIYLTFAGREGGQVTTKLARGQFMDDRLEKTEVLFAALTRGSGGRHFGSRIVFDPDGYLWMTVGERGSADEAQDPSNHNGTTLRLHDDGSVPEDNPFVGDGDRKAEIWSFGHRNAQGMAVEPESGILWQNEHGPRGGDEINIPRRGLNYGWPVTTHGTAYSGLPVGIGPEAPDMEPPLLNWTPSIGPSGMAFYTGDKFPAWRGDIFVGGLAIPQLRRVILEGGEIVGEEELLADLGIRIRDVRNGPDGYLYLLSDHRNGALLRLEPAETDE